MSEKLLPYQFLLAVLNYRLFGVRRPFFVSWRITNRCTRNCLYCDRTKESCREIDLPAARRLIREMAQAGTRWINLTGGDPLLWPGVIDLIGDGLGLGIKISINSNGDLLPGVIDRIPKEVEIGMSLDGPEEIHDALRGKGAFSATMKALSLARLRGCKVNLTCVISKLNCDNLTFVLKTADECGVDVLFQRITPTAMNSDRGHDLSPSADQLEKAIDFLQDEITRGNLYIANSCEGLSHMGEGIGRVVPRCVAGSLAARVTPQGDLSACWGKAVDDMNRVSSLEYGFEEAFRRLRPMTCSRCWCTGLIEANLGVELSAPFLWRRYVRQNALARRVGT